MIRYMTHLLCSKYLGNFFLALSLVLFSHKISATSWAYTETLVSLDNEFARDTVYLEYDGFIDRALEQLGQIKAAQVSVSLAQNQVQEFRDQRILPSLRMESEHGILPSVISPRGYPDNEIYLDKCHNIVKNNMSFSNF